MSVQHHPADELLLALAAGRLPSGQAVLVTVHLDGCRHCRAQLHLLQALGGVLLEEAVPQPLAPEALGRALAQIDAAQQRDAASGGQAGEPPMLAPGSASHAINASRHPPLPAGLVWPESLEGCQASGWRWMGPGIRWSRLRLPQDADARLYLLRIAPGRSLPRHSHSDLELTQVLYGSFSDGRARFGPGDFDAADESVGHQPIVAAGSECICLAYLGGPLRFEGRLAGLIGGWVGM